MAAPFRFINIYWLAYIFATILRVLVLNRQYRKISFTGWAHLCSHHTLRIWLQIVSYKALGVSLATPVQTRRSWPIICQLYAVEYDNI